MIHQESHVLAEVVYGKIGSFGHLIHVSQLGDQIEEKGS
jgi:hypothetical protein